MSKNDLEERTFNFATQCRSYCRTLDKKDPIIWDDVRQLIRSSGSVGANYIEANEALSKKDFVMRIKICRKEAKESVYWLRLIDGGNQQGRMQLIDEATQLTKIFGAILEKSK